MDKKYFFDVDKKVKLLIEQCIQELEALNVPIAQSVYFREGGGTQTWGYCYLGEYFFKYRDYEYVIAINKYLKNDKEIKETIIHELLHTINIAHWHGGDWKKWANYVNEKTDYTIKRTYECELKSGAFWRQKRNEVFDAEKIMHVTCPQCGNKILIKKTTRITKYGNTNVICRNCNSYYYKFIPDSIAKNFSDSQKKEYIENICSNFVSASKDEIITLLPYLNQFLRDYLLLQLFLKQSRLFISMENQDFINFLLGVCTRKAKIELAEIYMTGYEPLQNITELEFICFSGYFSLTNNFSRVCDYWVSLGNKRV